MKHNRLYVCKLCGKTFNNNKDLEEHLIEYHKVKNIHYAYEVYYENIAIDKDQVKENILKTLPKYLQPDQIEIIINKNVSCKVKAKLYYKEPLTLFNLYEVFNNITKYGISYLSTISHENGFYCYEFSGYF